MTRCLLLAIFFSMVLIGGDKQACTWMNAATAAGILDGAVDVKARPTACEFARQKSPAYTLQIEVGTGIGSAGKCLSNPTRLKAIGNEAVACAVEGRGGQRIERVVGRVREQSFLIRVSTNDPSATEESLLEKSRRAAEQVAGNLF